MAVDLNNGLVGYWPMDEGAGSSTTEDQSSQSNDGTLYNIDNSNWINGKSGTALNFNGTDEHIECGNDSSLNVTTGLSVSAWIKSADVSSWSTILSKLGADDAHSAIYFYIYNNYVGLRVYDSSGGQKSVTSSTIYVDTWYHVIGIYDGSDLKLYLNNVLVDTETSVPTINTNVNSVLIADNERWTGEEYTGVIDEVRYYNRELNSDERQYLSDHPGGYTTDSTSYRIVITDLDGADHSIITDIRSGPQIDIVASSSADTFSFEITNIDDMYSYIKRGCEIEISTGVNGDNSIKLTGIITDVVKQLEGQLVIPIMSISGEDVGSRLKNIKFSKRYYDLEISALVKAILDDTDFSTGKTYRELADVSSNYTYIESTAYTVGIASYTWKSLSSAIAELAESVGFEWYVDINKVLHFYDPLVVTVSNTITDDDLHGNPVINDIGEIVNRAIVIGGYQEVTDQSGSTQTTTFKVTNAISKNESFVPSDDYLNSVFVYTELETGSQSEIEISIQANSAAAPDGINLANGKYTLPLDSMVDGGYSEFKFENVVTLTPGETYWIVLDGTTTDGQLIGVDGSGDVDFETKSPARVAVIANDTDSQDSYGMYMAPVYRDENLIDPDLAEQKANQMLNGTPKKSANVVIHGTDVTANDVIVLTISKVGVSIDKTMKVIKSSQVLDQIYIINSLELEEV